MRTLRHIAGILATTLIAVSCMKEAAYDKARPVDEFPDNTILLQFGVPGGHSMLSTKAPSSEKTIRGEDALNENKIVTVDCFIYPENATETTQAVISAVGVFAQKVDMSAEFPDSTVYQVRVPYTNTQAEALGAENITASTKCKAFVIANASLTYGNTDLETLKTLTVERNFTQNTIQDRFVMLSTGFSEIKGVQQAGKWILSGVIPVKRLAAKIKAYVKIMPWEDALDDDGVFCRWRPKPTPDPANNNPGLRISLTSSMRKAYVKYDTQKNNWISLNESSDIAKYGKRDMVELSAGDLIPGMEDYIYTADPFYSYPMHWSDFDGYASNFLIEIPWEPTVLEAHTDPSTGETTYTETSQKGAIKMRTYQVSANADGTEFAPNMFYRVFIEINNLNGLEKEEEVILRECSYIVTDWLIEGASASGSGLVEGQFTAYNYLVVEPTQIQLDNITEYEFDYLSSSTVHAEITSISYDVYGSGTVVHRNWSVNASTYNLPRETINNQYVTIDPNEFRVSVDQANNKIVFEHDLTDVYSERNITLRVWNDTHEETLTIRQIPAISLKTDPSKAGNVYVNGYFGRVQYPAEYTGTKWSTLLNNYYRCNTGWSRNNSRSYSGPSTTNNYGTISNAGSSMSEGISDNFYVTEIVISGFNSTNHQYRYRTDTNSGNNYTYRSYRIGDPRTLATEVYNSWSLNDYLYWNTTTNREATAAWDSSDLEAIKITSQSDADQNIISPKFIVSSALNANLGISDMTMATKRAATYQEAGYPAGRWRLPTEAELSYIIERQLDKSIPGLFANNSYYWVGSGRLAYVNTNGGVSFWTYGSNPSYTLSNAQKSLRFVYDTWYWGDEPVDGAYCVYTIAP